MYIAQLLRYVIIKEKIEGDTAMKKIAVLLLAVSLLLCACAAPQIIPPETSNDTEPTEVASVPTTEATEPSVAPTEPPHSALYLPEYSADKMLEFFDEVVLNMEFSDGTGDVTLVQKWLNPIYYNYYGNPTAEDKAVLEALFAQLNAVPGFPGIYPAQSVHQENLSLSFLNRIDFNNSFQDAVHGEDAYGVAQFWYWTATNEIYTARIGYRTDISQAERNSVLIEEIINTLGISDTVLRPDSIVYQYSNDNLALSDVDWVILKLLYDPEIACGMNQAQCREVVLQRYY